MAAGLERPSGGEVRLFGQDLSRLGEDGRARLRRGRVSLVFQSFHLLPNMTAEENVAAPLEIARAPRRSRTARDWLDRVGLANRGRHYPHQLSGGEQQRVALARALAARPALLFADEPTGNLDAANAAKVADLMFDLVAETGAALVLVTHDAELAARADGVAAGDGRMCRTAARMIPLSLRFAARELRSGVQGLPHLPGLPGAGRGGDRGGGVDGRGLPARAGQRRRRRSWAATWRCRPSAAFAGSSGAPSSGQGQVSLRRLGPRHGRGAAGERRLVELRGVDEAYPLVGKVELDRRSRAADAAGRCADQAATPGAAVEQALLDRLRLKLGDRFTVADKPFVARAVLVAEPDRLSRGFALGPRVLVRMKAFDAVGLRDSPGFRRDGAARAAAGASTPRAAIAELRRLLPDAGFRIRDRTTPRPASAG